MPTHGVLNYGGSGARSRAYVCRDARYPASRTMVAVQRPVVAMPALPLGLHAPNRFAEVAVAHTTQRSVSMHHDELAMPNLRRVPGEQVCMPCTSPEACSRLHLDQALSCANGARMRL